MALSPDRIQRLVGIVKNMSGQGMGSDQIRENLVQMGIADEDINTIFSAADLQTSVADVAAKQDDIKDLLESGEHLEPVMKKMDEHGEGLERVSASLGELHEKASEIHADVIELQALKDELDEVKALVLEMKPLLASIERLNKNIIDSNRELLLKASKK